ncbi:MAG: antitoxin VbhA family protein [Gammaproteobacteria bacterium]|nr:antitoxin VbhA family protein [Gammaproteobacteria bacterium]
MKTIHKNLIKFTGRIGSAEPELQVRQAMANTTLEGLKPSAMSVKLAHAVASGKITTDDAIAKVIKNYGCHA